MWSEIENLISSFNLQLGLLIGTGLLAISLLVLALTRWGQSSPVWKCVILSFAAHILLIVYAYSTHLIFETSSLNPPGKENLRVNLIAQGDEPSPDNQNVKGIPDWTRDPNAPDLPPIVESLERPDIDSEVVIERIMPELTDVPQVESDAVLPTPLAMDEIDPVRPELTTDVIADRQNPKIDSPEMPVERRQQTESQVIEPPLFSEPRDVPQMDSPSEFQPQPNETADLNPHVNGLDSSLIDPHSQFSNSEQPILLPAPLLNPQGLFTPPEMEPIQTLFKRTSTPLRKADGKPMPAVYSFRQAADREQIMSQRGGSAETEAAVQAALAWLVKSQEPNGRWDADRWGAGIERQVLGHDRKGAGADADTGITGLATLALLAGGHTHLEGAYQDSVKRALDFLVLTQRPNGDLGGDSKIFARTYCHSMALLAISEALAVTGDLRLMAAVQKGVDFSVQAQNRIDGGWRYQPGDSGDMSQHGWQVLALQSAKMGGARVPDVAFERMKMFVESCASGNFGGLASYRPRHGVSTSMTAEALVCRFILQEELSYNTILEAARRISTERPTSLHINLYYWYYGTLAMYQVGGNEWELWNAEMKKALLSTQVKGGAEAGSWAPDCIWGGYGGRVYSTALATLNLQVYYRYMPNHRSASIIQDDEQTFIR